MTSSILAQALEFAENEYYVFPVRITLDGDGKKMPKFYRGEPWNMTSTRDPERLSEMFASRDDWTGFGIDCGKSGIVVIDLDVSDDKDGYVTWATFDAAQHSPMSVLTRSGGKHLYFRDPDGTIRNDAGKRIGPGVDVRGNGGFVFGPGTFIAGTDTGYELETSMRGASYLPNVSGDLRDVLMTRSAASTPTEHYTLPASRYQWAIDEHMRFLTEAADAMDGERDATCISAIARSIQVSFMVLDDVLNVDGIVADYEVKVPYDIKDLSGKAERAYEWAARTPRAHPSMREQLEWIDEVETLHARVDELALPFLPGDPTVTHALVAQAVAEKLEGNYLYVRTLEWHMWDGTRWSKDCPIDVRHAINEMIREESSKARGIVKGIESNETFLALSERVSERDTKNELRRKENKDALPETASELKERETLTELKQAIANWASVAQWWTSLSNGNSYDQVMKSVKVDPHVYVSNVDALDSQAHLLNCTNGTVDLRTGELMPHNPRDLITKSTNVRYDPSATHSLWDKAREAFSPDIEEWLQARIGIGAFGMPDPEENMLFNFGKGSNGKSVIGNALVYGMGEYTVVLHDKAILANEHDHGTEKMVFRGARWCVLEELPEAQVLRPAHIKKLVGTEFITARVMRQDNVTFTATHSVMVNSNHVPQVLETDHGIWRRLLSIPWPFTYRYQDKGEELRNENDRWADKGVKNALRDNSEVREAALAWIIAGAVRYTKNGGTCGPIPASIRESTEAWRGDSDVLGQFVSEACVIEPGYVISGTEFLERFNAYLASLGKRPVADAYVKGRIVDIPGVTADRVRLSKKVQLSTGVTHGNGPVNVRGYVGIRWQTRADSGAEQLEMI